MANPEKGGMAEKVIFAGNVVDAVFLVGGILTGNTLWAVWGIAGLAGGKWGEGKVKEWRKKGIWIP